MSDGASDATRAASRVLPVSGGLSWRQRLVVPASLLALDLATKYLAFFAHRGGSFRALGAGAGGDPRPLVTFGFLANDTGSNALADRVGSGSAALLVLFSACYAVIALVAILLNRRGAPRWARGLSYAGLVVACAIVAGRVAMAPPSPTIALGPWTLALIRFAGGLVFGLTFLALAKEAGYARIWGLFVAGGLGNFLCILLPPFAVIDFINLPRIPAAADLYFNLADLYVVAFWAALLAWPALRRLVRAAGPGRRGRNAGRDPRTDGTAAMQAPDSREAE